MELEELYDKYYRVIYDYLKFKAWKNLNILDLEEIINKSILVLYEKYKNKIVNHNFESYLKGISYNVMRNLGKYKKRYYDHNIELESYHYNKRTNHDILAMLINKEQHEIIIMGINELEEIEKNIIILHYFYDYNYLKIGIMYNISYKKVKSFEYTALCKLKIYLENNYFNY